MVIVTKATTTISADTLLVSLSSVPPLPPLPRVIKMRLGYICYLLFNMAIPVVELSKRRYKIKKAFG